MSLKYPGGFITKNYVAPTPSAAKGVWTLDQQMQAQKTGTWPFGGPFNYIEDVFSTYLYTGNSSTQNIVNGIDLAGKGGLVWCKARDFTYSHVLTDTLRGTNSQLNSNTTVAAETATDQLTAFSTTGFSVGAGARVNETGKNYASWTFRKQPKFFDVVTFTGNSSNRTIAHNLGSAPGMIVIKNLTSDMDWIVYHTATGATQYLSLNTTASATTSSAMWNNTAPTSTVFSLGTDFRVNNATNQFVAYLFAHNAGGFGLTNTDNVVSCGSYVGTGEIGNTITVGYEPQWVMIKASSGTSAASQDWYIYDVMRGMPVGNAINDNRLMANLSSAEASYPEIGPTATGFVCEATGARLNESGTTYIYIAIRRGPMKVPTDATKVFSPFTTAAATGTAVTTNFPVDFQLYKYRAGIDYWFDVDRLRGVNSTTTGNTTPWLDTTATTAEATATNVSRNWGNTGFEVPGIVGGASNVFYSFQRAPGFFDEVCYTGTGVAGLAITHNLNVVPELMIVKARSNGAWWPVYCAPLSISGTTVLGLNYADAAFASAQFNGAPTASTFQLASSGSTNTASQTYVAYLFATCPGVSKVGSYTGTGATQTIACGFAAGARFVLIKRTDSTGDWYVWDSARGMVSGTDPSLLLNSTAAEVNANSVYAITTGFQIVSTAAGINASGGSYIFLAIA